ncbi:MAG TPA: hypothetical protein VKZ41_02580 [Gemmatimonadales bacterium]|nr:hypothetical protein [Gemmatimonadales bacterium]
MLHVVSQTYHREVYMAANDRRIQGEDAEAAYGGADAVEKTTYVVGDGTEPEARQQLALSARAGPGSGPPALAWIALALLIVALVVYLPGVRF